MDMGPPDNAKSLDRSRQWHGPCYLSAGTFGSFDDLAGPQVEYAVVERFQDYPNFLTGYH
jgi:hypothetical protein